jgi:hypothetical protein
VSSTAAPGYYQQQPPPKKKHTVRNVIFALTVLTIVGLAGCLALLASGANSVDKAI